MRERLQCILQAPSIFPGSVPGKTPPPRQGQDCRLRSGVNARVRFWDYTAMTDMGISRVTCSSSRRPGLLPPNSFQIGNGRHFKNEPRRPQGICGFENIQRILEIPFALEIRSSPDHRKCRSGTARTSRRAPGVGVSETASEPQVRLSLLRCPHLRSRLLKVPGLHPRNSSSLGNTGHIPFPGRHI